MSLDDDCTKLRNILVLSSVGIMARAVGRRCACVPRTRDALHVLLPCNAFRFEKVNDRRNVLWYLGIIVVVKAEVISSNRGDIIRLRRMRQSIVRGKEYPLLRQFLVVCILCYRSEILQRE